jgi:hypothetical protein
MHLELHDDVQGPVHLHHDPHVQNVKQQAHGEFQEALEAHQIDQHEQEVVVDALRSACSCSGCVPCTP